MNIYNILFNELSYSHFSLIMQVIQFFFIYNAWIYIYLHTHETQQQQKKKDFISIEYKFSSDELFAVAVHINNLYLFLLVQDQQAIEDV